MGEPKRYSDPTEARYTEKPTDRDMSTAGAQRAYRDSKLSDASGLSRISTSSAGPAQQEYKKRPRSSSQPSQSEHEVSALKAALKDYKKKLRAEESKNEDLESARLRDHEIMKQLGEQYKELKRDSKWTADRYKYITHHFLRPFEQHVGHKFDDSTSETIDSFLQPFLYNAMEAIPLRERVHALGKESQESSHLREQFQALQAEMLARVDKVQTTSDEQFAKDFRALVGLIKTLSRMVSCFDNTDPADKLGTPILLDGVSPRHWKGRSRMKFFIEPYVWSILIHWVFRDPFKIFGALVDGIGEDWVRLFGTEHWHQWPRPTGFAETWRYTTVERLIQMASEQVDLLGNHHMVAEGAEEGKCRNLLASGVKAREVIVTVLMTGLATVASAYDMAQIRQIVEKAFELSEHMSLQRARIQLTFPLIGYPFQEGEMAQVRDDDDEDTNEGIVDFIHHPGLTKWGDAHGKNLDHKFDIVPSLVLVKATNPFQPIKHSYSDVVKREI
jgi:hypothetical protein